MAYTGPTFKFYTDSGLTTLFGGLYQLTHYTDLSDGDQDFVLYFGSTYSARILQANSSPGVDSIIISVADTLPSWAATTAYSLGAKAQPLASPNGYRYEVTTAGTSSGSEPTWPTTVGDTVADGTVVWTCDSVKHEETEVKLASTSGGLDTATAGASLDLGTVINGGVANAVEVHIRVTNAVTDVGDNTSYPALALQINEVRET